MLSSITQRFHALFLVVTKDTKPQAEGFLLEGQR